MMFSLMVFTASAASSETMYFLVNNSKTVGSSDYIKAITGNGQCQHQQLYCWRQ